MGLGDELDAFLGVRKRPGKRNEGLASEGLDALLGVKRRPPVIVPGGVPQPAEPTFTARSPVGDAEGRFAQPVLIAPAERLAMRPPNPDDGYVTLPPHLSPSKDAEMVYERRAVNIDAGENLIVLDFPVPSRKVFYWSGVGTDMHLSSFYQFWFDENVLQQISGPAQVGTILQPFKFPAAFKATKRVYLRAYNFNSVPFTYECAFVGWLEEAR